MIHLDNREGGPNQADTLPKLTAALTSHRLHPQVNTTRLHAGDFYFDGEGPTGPCAIGIERKRIMDFFNSLHSGRLAGEQIPKLIDTYEHFYIIVEGPIKVDWDTGVVQEMRGGQWQALGSGFKNTKDRRHTFTGQELLGAINTLTLFTPARVIRTFSTRDTLDVVATLWSWWQKPWTQHHSHHAMYTHQSGAVSNLGKAGVVRRTAKELTGVGWERSGTVAAHFRHPKDMILPPGFIYTKEMTEAMTREWARLDGFGPKLSKNVVRELTGEGEATT